MFSASRCLLLAGLLLSAVTQYHAADAQIVALAPAVLDRTGWTATADSTQANEDNDATNVLDGDPNSFWHTQWDPTNAPLPHNIVLDMQNTYVVNGLNYLPRQDGYQNGNIGQHTIDLSTDSKTWTTVASGTWVNDQSLKTTYFAAKVARYVRLTAQTEAQGAGYQWTSAAEIQPLTNPHSTLPRAAWVINVDSQEQYQGHNFNGTEAVDGAITTFWHTQYTSAQPALPHYFAIDQGKATTVGGLSYLPRPPSTGANGRIGSYQVQRSSDGNSWTTIAAGTWADTEYLKTVEFAAVSSRYIRLVALTEAGGRGPWTSASEINLLDGSTQLNDFDITVDSQETLAYNNSGVLAGDDDETTFWHTPWSVDNPPDYPHFLTIDMRAVFPVHALTYIPRQDGYASGRIGAHEIDVSTDGNTWAKVAKGTFFDDPTAKMVNFLETNARYVRLTATSEAGNRGPWASAAEVTLSFDTSYTAPATSLGQWGQMIDFPVVPVAAAMIPSTGKVLAWSSWSGNDFDTNPGGETATAEYDFTTGVVTQRVVSNTDHDMFCPGLSLDFNGRPFVTGGNDAQLTSVYEPSNDSWDVFPQMVIARGYQASATLSDGRIFTIGGSWSGGEGGKNGEVFSMHNNAWSLLPGCPVAPMLTNDPQGVYRADNHGWLFSWHNGTVFQAGPSAAMNWYSTTNGGGVQSAGPRGDDTDAMNGNAVMYDAVAGKILAVGGATAYQGTSATSNAHVITLGTVNQTASVTKLGGMAYRRAFANAVVLPDGSVLVVGGQEWPDPFSDDDAILYPELWSPTTRTFRKMAPMVVPRTYHSVALLMPDATVISGGGGLCDGCSTNHFDAQIFSPPYLFNADGSAAVRPVISAVTSTKTASSSGATVSVGGTLRVTTSTSVTAFSLIRSGSATHTVDTDQRRISLTPLTTGTNSYTLTIPGDPGVALPGAWMLFAVNAAGVPSLATTVQVLPVAAVS